ncbi:MULTISPECIES: PHP domain-containing protein [Halorubrum]|uniref:histidinol-phosphatase n=1 Tax=Halorubrum sodomense TaxID=35743 RepID=A0A1I6H8K4_HALSD|nr:MULTISPECIES: PHP domain-containing protein [Halorubrum]TKX55796.1 histidinol-phosphatase [Halorubrum sp. SP3]TKX71423.1 histidinol-phosphatase [Halorubrum sp. SP9]SFR50772.1 histidinol-phosphatase (PHP family) [Halorubrum sodomense]
MYDYHAHTNYSDGAFLRWMVEAAADAGLDGIGFADHCNVSPEPSARRHKRAFGFNLDLTYERRREAIEAVREDVDVEVFDAAEMDYDPAHEEAIAAFLDDAGFDYAVGSVHDLDGANVHTRSHFADKPESERRALVDRYFEKLVALVESELFAVAAHPDLIERNPHLRGFATEDHYASVVDAFRDSRTVPEINAGRLLDDYGEFHPAPAFLDRLVDAGVEVTVGTDSHEPDAIAPRVREIEAELDRRELEAVRLDHAVNRS